MGKEIYVETCIHAPMDKLWDYTQNPSLHQQWDLRFSEITYLPKENEHARQKFLYKTNIGFGLSISGEGESYGTKESKGVRTSTLAFGTDHPISLIDQGSGFWRYIPTEKGIIFLTKYDYKTRFGKVGQWFDSLLFRPMIGWATAWSFDALRLWLELGIHPNLSIRRAVQMLLIRMGLFFLWFYQGLIPKLIYHHDDELNMLSAIGLFQGQEYHVLTVIGVLEIIFGALFLFCKGKSYALLHVFNIGLLIALMFSALVFPSIYTAPFNPITLNVAMILLSCISLVNRDVVASASKCRRKPMRRG